jgi:hypothetical protein
MKMKHNIPESVGYSKGHAKGKVYSYNCLHLKKKKTETSQINYLMMNLKTLEKQEQIKHKTSRQTEIMETKQTIQRINETKSLFFEKINKIDKPLANMTKQKREETQINKIRDGKGRYNHKQQQKLDNH